MKKILPLLLALSVLTACIKEREYKLDEGLLDEMVTSADLNLSFRVPVGAKGISDQYIDEYNQRLLQTDPLSPIYRAIYVDTLMGGYISLTDMRMLPYELTENRLDFYKTEYNRNHIWDDVEKNIFKMGDYPKVVELIMYNQDETLRRYMFYNEEKAQFYIDYDYPTALAETMKPYIESSLASIGKHYELYINAE
ncbi:MAG: hypothetical protein J6Y77_02805 [Paludibacteraceae bacterium]|nr:hypothetical protein [Paludibacteraceae bacterium]